MVKNDVSIIAPTFKHLKTSFRSGKTLDIKYRKQQLQHLIRGLNVLSEKFYDALHKDLGQDKTFSMLMNVKNTIEAVQEAHDSLSSWVKPTSVDTPLLLAPAKSYILPEPMGVILCLGTWNYPVSTAIPYVACAIAAGNCVVFKPSEISPSTSAVFVELFEHLDSDCYRCIEGEFEVAEAIVKQPFDTIVFTGSSEKGRMVAKAAAENLTPCIMELGGKCPTIVNREAKLDSAALKIARARYLNAGQTCLACDYVFVHKDVKAKFTEILIQKIKQFYGEDPSKSRDYSRVINTNHTRRLRSYLDEDHGGKVLLGGEVKIDEKYVAPTVIDSPRYDSLLMKEEIFGPILPIYEFNNIEEVVEFINDRPKPLAAYYYGSAKSPDFKQLKLRTSSGTLVCNESFLQVANNYLPFGGVGDSGMGKLMGYAGFKSLSHMKSVMEANTMTSFPNSALFPPFNNTTRTVAERGLKYAWVTQNHIWRLLKMFLALLLLTFLFTSVWPVFKSVEKTKGYLEGKMEELKSTKFSKEGFENSADKSKAYLEDKIEELKSTKLSKEGYENPAEKAKETLENSAEQTKGIFERSAEKIKGVFGSSADKEKESLENSAEQRKEVPENSAEQEKEILENSAEQRKEVSENSAEQAKETSESSAEHKKGVFERSTDKIKEVLKETLGEL